MLAMVLSWRKTAKLRERLGQFAFIVLRSCMLHSVINSGVPFRLANPFFIEMPADFRKGVLQSVTCRRLFFGGGLRLGGRYRPMQNLVATKRLPDHGFQDAALFVRQIGHLARWVRDHCFSMPRLSQRAQSSSRILRMVNDARAEL